MSNNVLIPYCLLVPRIFTLWYRYGIRLSVRAQDSWWIYGDSLRSISNTRSISNSNNNNSATRGTERNQNPLWTRRTERRMLEKKERRWIRKRIGYENLQCAFLTGYDRYIYNRNNYCCIENNNYLATF